MSDKQTDMCTCGHTRAAHFEAKNQECSLGDCICAAFDKVDPVRQVAPEMLKVLEALDAFWGNVDGEPICEAPIYPGAYITDQDVPIRDLVRAAVRKARGGA